MSGVYVTLDLIIKRSCSSISSLLLRDCENLDLYRRNRKMPRLVNRR